MPRKKKTPAAVNKVTKRSKSAPRRSYSTTESRAWSTRPYRCSVFSDALQIYKTKQDATSLQTSLWRNLPRNKTYVEWCFRHEHPTRTGIKGKIYHRSDVIGSISDAMVTFEARNDDSFGLGAYIKKKSRKRRAVTFEDEKPPPPSSSSPPTSSWKPPAPTHAWTCRGCGSHNRNMLVLGHDGYVCPCGACAGSEIVSANRQKLGALEGDDKTITGDNPTLSRTDRFDRGPQSAAEARASRVANLRTTSGGRGQAQAQALIEKEAAKSIVAAEVAAGIALPARDRVKQRAVLGQVEELFKLLHPVDHAVKRMIRMKADATYVAAVQHGMRCSHDFCELRLAERHTAAIAHAVFEYTVDELHENPDLADLAVDTSRLKDLRDRMHRSSAFMTVSSATQLASSKLMIDVINAPGFDYKKVCEKCKNDDDDDDIPAMPTNFAMVAAAGGPVVTSLNGLKPPPSLRPLASPCMQRSLSICSNGETSPTPSKQVEWRNAISAIFVAHRAELSVAVRDAALRVIQVSTFLNACEGEPTVVALDSNQLAFCLLNAVVMEQAASADTVSLSKNSRLNRSVAEKIDLELVTADAAIRVLRAALPVDDASDQSERDADDLFS